MAYNQSRIKLFRRCQRAYAFRYDTSGDTREMVPKVPSLPLKRGSWLHALQEELHREWAGIETEGWRARHQELTAEYQGLFDEEKALLGDLPGDTMRLFRGYLRFSEREGDGDRYTVATLPGGGPGIEWVVSVPLHKYGVDGEFKGRLDLLVEDREYGGLWIWDAKWVKNLPKYDDRMLSPQSLLYVWACWQNGIPIRGFVYNYGRTKPPTQPLVLTSGYLSTAKKIDTTYEVYLRAIKRQHPEMWRKLATTRYYSKLKDLQNRETMWYRRERVPIDKDRVRRALQEFIHTCRDIERRKKKYPPRTYEYNCSFTCQYHRLCVAEFTGLDIEGLMQKYYTLEDERYSQDEMEDKWLGSEE